MQRTGLVVVLIGSVFLAGWAGRTADPEAAGEGAGPNPAAPAPADRSALDLGLVMLYRDSALAAASEAWRAHDVADSGARPASDAPLGITPADRSRVF